MSFSSRAFRDALGCFATGVTVVTCQTPAGPVGITVNSFTSVSLEPPLVSWCLDREATVFDAFSACSHFAVNVLEETQRHLSVRFAAPAENGFDGLAWDEWETGAPILHGVLASFDCRVEARHEAGDHVLLIGRVLRLSSRATGSPLIYLRGRYRGVSASDGVAGPD
jgi:flavin reductase (DIM6/NTAB) family NADH-FMN oxidoreductase RutF